MNNSENDAQKRALHKLLREYDSNSGMAAFVCSRPVELLPEDEQQRIINGFCNEANLKVLEVSKKKLSEANKLELSESEDYKVNTAIPIIDNIYSAFDEYMKGAISLSCLREKVRGLVEKPIPDNKEELIDSLSKLIEAIDFLATQNISSKDDWDRLVDCSQMHDVLNRSDRVCSKLLTLVPTDSIKETQALVNRKIEFLESYFKGSINPELIEDEFKQLASQLKAIWSE